MFSLPPIATMPNLEEISRPHANGQLDSVDQPLHVIIVGGGLGGLANAIACSLTGHSVTVLEAAVQLGEVGAGIQLTPNVTRHLKRWGVSKLLEKAAVEPRTIYMRRWQDGRAIGRTKLVPEFRDNFGAPYWVVHRAHLHQALHDRALDLGVQVFVNSRVAEIDFDEGTVTTTKGTQYSGDLIVGCDGIKSTTRALFLGGPSADPGPAATPFCAYRATVPIRSLQHDPDVMALLENMDLNLWLGEGRHVMTYCISGGETFNLVLSHPDTSDPSTWSTDRQDILAEMRRNYEGWDPTLLKIIHKIESTSKWKLLTYPRMENWIHPSGKFVLGGDAVHAMLPYMSQGAASAIEDAAVLGRCLSWTDTVPALDLLETYQLLRKERSYAVQRRSALNGTIWHFADGPEQAARDAGMAAELTEGHYIRSTNQWSDPATQCWLYGGDVAEEADAVLKAKFGKESSGGQEQTVSGIQAMIGAGLLVSPPSDV